MNPRVSLLVPVFNRAELLGPCIDSALAQTFVDFEVVVVDGASSDGTWEVCLRYAAADPRVRVFRDQVNTGPARGWWRCVEEARGSLGTFLWSDDLLRPTFLEQAVPFLADPDVAFVFAAAEVGSDLGFGEVHYDHGSRAIERDEFIRDALSERSEYPVSPACALFRMADIKSHFVFELPTLPPADLTQTGAGIDLLLFLSTAAAYPRIRAISEPLSFFRSHPGSLTVDGRGGQVALGYALARSWFAFSHGYRQFGVRILAKQWLREVVTARRFVDPSAAAKRYRLPAAGRDLVMGAAILMPSAVRRAVARRIRRDHHHAISRH